MEEIGETGKWKTLPDDFLKHIRRAMASCSRDMSRPVLTCVNITAEGRIEASDSLQITKCQLEEPMPVKTFLLPANSAVEVIRLHPTKIAEGNGWIHFKTDEGTILSCRIFEDEFPDTAEHLKVEGVEITLPKQIDEILDRAAIFASRDHFLDENVTIKNEDHFVKEDKGPELANLIVELIKNNP